MITEKVRKIAVVHDWLDKYSGAERVLECLVEMYPECDLFSLVDYLPQEKRGFIQNKSVTTTFIQRLPFSKKHFRKYLPLMPIAIEQLDLSEYDLIISSSHAVAKSVLTGPDQIHISYVHTPMRYAWDMQFQYFDYYCVSGLKGLLIKYFLHKIRIWDQVTANRPDIYIANSNFIRHRIQKFYGKRAEVIFPPVSKDFQYCAGVDQENYYITVSRLVPYKRLDLIIDAFKQMPNKLLKIVGTGSEIDSLRKQIGDSGNIELLGYKKARELNKLLSSAKGFVYAAKEDFGIAVAEAQVSGVPVIALGVGGVKDIVLSGQTGFLFSEQTPESLVGAIQSFEEQGLTLSRQQISEASIERFSKEKFMQKIKNVVDKATESRGQG